MILATGAARRYCATVTQRVLLTCMLLTLAVSCSVPGERGEESRICLAAI